MRGNPVTVRKLHLFLYSVVFFMFLERRQRKYEQRISRLVKRWSRRWVWVYTRYSWFMVNVTWRHLFTAIAKSLYVWSSIFPICGINRICFPSIFLRCRISRVCFASIFTSSGISRFVLLRYRKRSQDRSFIPPSLTLLIICTQWSVSTGVIACFLQKWLLPTPFNAKKESKTREQELYKLYIICMLKKAMW